MERITRAPVLPSRCCDVPPFRIAGIVCEEIRWQIKMQWQPVWNSIEK
jgi:hypothetical protein